MNALLLSIVLAAILSGASVWRRRRYLRRRRIAYDASWRPDVAAPQIEELVRVARAAIGPDVLRAPELEVITLHGNTPTERLLDALRLVTTRFGITDETIGAVYSPDVPSGLAATVSGEHSLEAVAGRDRLILRQGDRPVRWRIHVVPHLAKFERALVAMLGHEVAHIALKSRGVWLDDRAKNELLTETAAVLAGFGPLMREAAYAERWEARVAGDDVTVTSQGYLHQRTIDLLMDRRRELSRTDDGGA